MFIGAAVLLLAVGAGVVFAAQRFIQDSKWVIQTTTILRELDDIATLEGRGIAAQRGYILTNEPALRDQFWEIRARLLLEVAALRSRVSDEKATEQARELEPMIVRRFNLAARALALFEQDGLDAARSFISTNGSRQLDEQINKSLESLRAGELQLLSDRRAALDRSASLVMLAAALGIPISLAMLFMVIQALVRENIERRRAQDEATVAAHEYKQLSADMESLSRFAGMLQSCEDVTELLAIAEQGFSTFAPRLAGTIYLFRASRDHAESAKNWGTHSVPSSAMPAPGECWAIRRNQPYVCEDVQAGIHCSHVVPVAGSPPSSTACIPLSAQGRLMGWLYLSRIGAGPIAEYSVALQAAEQMSLALANVRLQEDLRHQSIRDPLTGLYNRRYLEESLAREIARCARRGLPLAVMIFDLDHFKAFNDVHGHPGGDTVLASFGRLLQANCRPEDIPCRYGGEEFVVILPEAGLETGIERAKVILASTAKMIVAHQGVTLGRVTTSIGLSSMPANGTTATALIESADKALYEAKAKGRNRVCVADGPCL
jgi:diguanylate cyclase (GGDEF)-like protein